MSKLIIFTSVIIPELDIVIVELIVWLVDPELGMVILEEFVADWSQSPVGCIASSEVSKTKEIPVTHI